MTEQDEILRDRLCIAMSDLVQAQRFGMLLLEPEQLGRDGENGHAQNNIRIALEIALVVSYARPFTQMRDRFGNREEPLEDMLVDLDEAELKCHSHHVSVVRNQEYAHSDASRYDLKWYESQIGSATPFQIPIMRNPFAPMPASEVQRLIGNCGKIAARMLQQSRTLEAS